MCIFNFILNVVGGLCRIESAHFDTIMIVSILTKSNYLVVEFIIKLISVFHV